ncbi:DUF3606 domain-containing protein [Pantoea sp. JGM49]|nr:MULTISPECIES: DUF3606 domain-containing protein [unclassified Pantoea]MBS0883887.1 DUF3606 domain-containing protein [Pantoea sp. JGM49]MXP53785.1 DUF3606 domain-containing protein [Pantoea sp. Seng]SNY56549.1 Protein of unknown function [Pantoea sp. GL120224-02]
MKDPIQRRIPHDLTQVIINEHWQITYWTLTLQTTQERLTRAIREVGSNTELIRTWLREHPPLITPKPMI